MRGLLVRGGVLLRGSKTGGAPAVNPERAGSTATAPGREVGNFFLFEGGMREVGRVVGTGSLSMARYTRCIAWRI